MPDTKVAIVMGSQSDWSTMKVARDQLVKLGVSFQMSIVSAHRTPERLYEFASEAYGKGIRVVIAGAGGSAHLPGMISAIGRLLLVFGVPCPSKTNALNDDAAVKSMAFMPGGVPLATYSIGAAGAKNAAIDAAKIVALSDPAVTENLKRYFEEQMAEVSLSPIEGEK